MATRKPEKVYRIGYVSASVFTRQVDTDDGLRTLRSVNSQKRYVDDGETKYTSSFSLAELPQAIRCLQMATSYVEQQEATINLNG